MTTWTGEIAALLTACFWTVTALSFEAAGKRVGSMVVNMIRLVMAAVFISVFTGLFRGWWLPLDAGIHQWTWLLLSGLIGFVMGDLFLFRAFVMIGARISMLIMSSVPILTTFLGWIFLHEAIGLWDFLGMLLTMTGIIIVLAKKSDTAISGQHRLLLGVIFAFGGAVGQAAGLILSKYGMGTYNAFAATQIRIFAGIIGFSILFFLTRRWHSVTAAFKDTKAIKLIGLGSFFGPFLGVSFSLIAVQNTHTGIAATIMSIVPILIIPPSVMVFGQHVQRSEIVGAFLAVSGVAVLFLV